MNIENLSPEKITLSEGSRGEKVINYGVINTKINTTVNAKITHSKPLNEKPSSSCGCTVPKMTRQKDGSYLLSITYDNKRKGVFTKTVKVTSKDKKDALVIKIKGEVRDEL